jgi:hypothetical protein
MIFTYESEIDGVMRLVIGYIVDYKNNTSTSYWLVPYV